MTDDVLEDGRTGIIVPQSDSAALSAAVVTLLADVELREKMGRDARQRAMERFALDAVARRYADLYTGDWWLVGRGREGRAARDRSRAARPYRSGAEVESGS